jgi:hypothetical protein
MNASGAEACGAFCVARSIDVDQAQIERQVL